MKLGKLIESLESQPKQNLIRFAGEIDGAVPLSLDSYRGYYDQLAISYEPGSSFEPKTIEIKGLLHIKGNLPTVGELLSLCKEAVGQTFTGYKGGDFTMDKSTSVWVSNYGEASGIKIVRVYEMEKGMTVIDTFCDDY